MACFVVTKVAMTRTLPVQRLGSAARAAYLAHLCVLAPEDLRLRFGSVPSPAALATYVHGIDFATDVLFGVHDARLALVGAVHLAINGDLAELGVSVAPAARKAGVGTALVARAAEHARNRAVPCLYMHCLAENVQMVRIAQRAGMDVIFDRGDADAHLALPPATALSYASEMLADRVALYDYALRAEVEMWRRLNAALADTTGA